MSELLAPVGAAANASFGLRRGPLNGLVPPAPAPSSPSPLTAFLPTLVLLAAGIRRELEQNLSKLLSLNPSRREAVAQHLERLAGIAVPADPDPAGALRRWIEGPRGPAQAAALSAFFDEVSLVALGQAILLKAWSDRGIRVWKEEDLGRLNWVLSSALKPHVPLDREGWQITRPNLYSWYNPSPSIQREIWNALDSWRITDEGPELLAGLLQQARQAHPDAPELKGYDARFFSLLWEHMASFGFSPTSGLGQPSALKRKPTIFSPTLRDGAMVRTGPASVQWIGLESHPFHLVSAELVQLWWGPSAPPIWALGTGLEAHSRDQLQLALGSPKPSLLSRIAEMEACDLAFVLEERGIRASTRSWEAQKLKEQLEGLPYFKKLRSQGTSLGDLQACVALSKLRPGGLLWWAREEPLSAADGEPMLAFLLERARIVCEWDLSLVEHSLPTPSALFPRFLYLMTREPDVQSRLSHRPLRVALDGHVRSHVEVPLLLSDALSTCHKRSGRVGQSARSHWQIHQAVSPTSQKEWGERWPDRAEHDTLRAIEELRAAGAPLATVTTIRPTPAGDSARDGAWSVHPSLKGLWLHAGLSSQGTRSLSAAPLPRPGQEVTGHGFLVLVSDEAWIAPLSAYLESEHVRSWLEHHAERRGDRWVLSEQLVKFLPVPRFLLQALGAPIGSVGGGSQEGSFAVPLPGEWEKLAAEVAYQPKLVRERLSLLPTGPVGQSVRAQLFVRAARAREQLLTGQRRLFGLVSPQGAIRWKELLDVLPRTECAAVTLHPLIRLSGTLPPHLPIHRIDRAKAPLPGVILATESGFNLHIGSENPKLVDMLWEQLQGLSHPTWSELAQYLRLPRRLELAESTANDVLASHGEQSARLRDLTDLMSACSAL